jgi:hypothetical protein
VTWWTILTRPNFLASVRHRDHTLQTIGFQHDQWLTLVKREKVEPRLITTAPSSASSQTQPSFAA